MRKLTLGSLVVALWVVGLAYAGATGPQSDPLQLSEAPRALNAGGTLGGYRSRMPDSVRAAAADARATGGSAPESPPVIQPSAPVPSCPAPCTAKDFETIDNVNFISPADETGAAGDNHVLAAVNVSYALYSRNGVVQIPHATLKSLFPSLRGFVTDPKVVYDQYNDRYVLAFISIQSSRKKAWIYLASVPDATAATQSTWCMRKIRADQSKDGTKQWGDYPALGYDGSRVYVTTNQFGFDRGYFGAQLVAFDDAGLYDCTQSLKFTTFSGKQMLMPGGRKADSIQPAATEGTSPSAEYMLSFSLSRCGLSACSGSELILWRVKDVSGTLKVTQTAIDVGKAVTPPFGTQKRGSFKSSTLWDTGDLRLTNAFYDADLNEVYGAHAVDKDINPADSYDEATARWYEVQPAGALGSSMLDRSGFVGMSGLDMGWPAVATDSLGNLFLTISGAGLPADEYLSAWSAVILPASSATIAPDKLTLGGDARYYVFLGVQRWGDYNAINRDPTDGTRVWSFNAATRTTGGKVTSNWVEVVHQLFNV